MGRVLIVFICLALVLMPSFSFAAGDTYTQQDMQYDAALARCYQNMFPIQPGQEPDEKQYILTRKKIDSLTTCMARQNYATNFSYKGVPEDDPVSEESAPPASASLADKTVNLQEGEGASMEEKKKVRRIYRPSDPSGSGSGSGNLWVPRAR